MKFAIVFAAFVACASSALVPLAYNAVPYAGSYANHVAVAPVAYSAYAAPITQYSSVDVVAHSPVAYHAPAAVAYHAAPAVAYHAAPAVVVPHGASYTAATRGAVHNAPLEGHAVSQTSLNLAPAPGTL